MACQSPLQYAIEGKIDGYNGRILLVCPNVCGGWDTLGNFVTPDGTFCFKGTLASEKYGEIHTVDNRVKIPVFLENSYLNVNVDIKRPQRYVVTGGGELQVLRNKLRETELRVFHLKDSLRDVYKDIYNVNESFGRLQMRTLLSKVDTVYEKAEEVFLKENDNIVSASILYGRMQSLFDNKCLNRKYALLGESARNSLLGEKLLPLLEKEAHLIEGGVAPNFTMELLNGTSISMYDVKAKVKVLDFWASWCGPCRAANPYVRELYKKYKSAGLEVIGISLDMKHEAWEKAVKEDQLEWLQLSDLKGWDSVAADLYDVHAIPCLFVLDQDNRIIAARVWKNDLEKYIKEKLEEK